MIFLEKLKIEDFGKTLSGPDGPGTVSCAACVIYLGSMVLVKSLRLIGEKKGEDDFIENNILYVQKLSEKSIELMNADSKAFLEYIQCQDERKERLLLKCCEIPVAVMNTGNSIIEIIPDIMRKYDNDFLCDIMSGVGFLCSGIESAYYNIIENLKLFSDKKYINSIRDLCDSERSEKDRIVDKIRKVADYEEI